MLEAADRNRLECALGLAMKAGKVRSGEFSVEKAIKSGAALAVVVDSSSSAQSKKRWADACGSAGIPIAESEDIGRAIGKEAHMVACIVENGFAQMLLRACKDIES